MPTVTRYPSSHNAGWTNSQNAYGNDGVYATAAPAKNGTTTVEYGGFGFDSVIPAGAIINSVTLDGIEITNAEGGEFIIILEPEDTRNLAGNFFHAARVTDLDGRTAVVTTGILTIRKSGAR